MQNPPCVSACYTGLCLMVPVMFIYFQLYSSLFPYHSFIPRSCSDLTKLVVCDDLLMFSICLFLWFIGLFYKELKKSCWKGMDLCVTLFSFDCAQVAVVMLSIQSLVKHLVAFLLNSFLWRLGKHVNKVIYCNLYILHV